MTQVHDCCTSRQGIGKGDRKSRSEFPHETGRHLATGAALVALILTFGPISGGHFNPAVPLAAASQGGISWHEVPLYIAAQIVGAFGGVLRRTRCSRRRCSSRLDTPGQEWLKSSASSLRPLGCSRRP